MEVEGLTKVRMRTLEFVVGSSKFFVVANGSGGKESRDCCLGMAEGVGQKKEEKERNYPDKQRLPERNHDRRLRLLRLWLLPARIQAVLALLLPCCSCSPDPTCRHYPTMLLTSPSCFGYAAAAADRQKAEGKPSTSPSMQALHSDRHDWI